MSSGRSVRGGIRAFLLGAEPRERDLSGVHRSEEGGENREEEEEGKEGCESGGGAGGGSSTDTVRGPRREENKRWRQNERKQRRGGWGGGGLGLMKRKERSKMQMLKHSEEEEAGESQANDVIMRSGSHDNEHVDQIASYLGHRQQLGQQSLPLGSLPHPSKRTTTAILLQGPGLKKCFLQ